MTAQELLADDYDWQAAVAISLDGNYQYRSGWGDESGVRVNVQEFVDTLADVIYKDEGERDADNWIVLFSLKEPVKDKTHVFVDAGCDYTGWDCQAGGTCEYTTLEEFKSKVGTTAYQRKRLGISLPDDDADPARWD